MFLFLTDCPHLLPSPTPLSMFSSSKVIINHRHGCEGVARLELWPEVMEQLEADELE